MDRARSRNPGRFPLGLASALAIGCSGSAAGLLPDAGQETAEAPNELGHEAAMRLEAGAPDLVGQDAGAELPTEAGPEAPVYTCRAGMTGEACSTAGSKCLVPCEEPHDGRDWSCRCAATIGAPGLSWTCTTGGDRCHPDSGGG
jgi:hypothetical protein